MEVLTECDINVVIYSTHSTRDTSASKSFAQGLSDKKLLKITGWNKVFTFRKHYNLTIVLDDTTEQSASSVSANFHDYV